MVGRFRGNADLDPSASGEFLVHGKKKLVNGKKKLTDDVFFAGFTSAINFLSGGQYGTTGNDLVDAASYNPLKNTVAAAVIPNRFGPILYTTIDIAVLD